MSKKIVLYAFLFIFTAFVLHFPRSAYAGYSGRCDGSQCVPGPAAPGGRGCDANWQCTAAIDFNQLQGALPNFNFTNKTVGDIVKEVIPYLFGAAGLILLLYLIWGGFTLMLSRGDQKAVEAARARITTAITGFIIIFVAYWLVQILGLILGIEQFGQIFK